MRLSCQSQPSSLFLLLYSLFSTLTNASILRMLDIGNNRRINLRELTCERSTTSSARLDTSHMTRTRLFSTAACVAGCVKTLACKSYFAGREPVGSRFACYHFSVPSSYVFEYTAETVPSRIGKGGRGGQAARTVHDINDALCVAGVNLKKHPVSRADVPSCVRIVCG
ncbi:MAG: hypothetical protein M1829_000067 [Trizodia sp. TS-e1964]|nr:MAG: hypothetical protein M1829_000067 [Trizodia sp. TS-e1964]